MQKNLEVIFFARLLRNFSRKFRKNFNYFFIDVIYMRYVDVEVAWHSPSNLLRDELTCERYATAIKKNSADESSCIDLYLHCSQVRVLLSNQLLRSNFMCELSAECRSMK